MKLLLACMLALGVFVTIGGCGSDDAIEPAGVEEAVEEPEDEAVEEPEEPAIEELEEEAGQGSDAEAVAPVPDAFDTATSIYRFVNVDQVIGGTGAVSQTVRDQVNNVLR